MTPRFMFTIIIVAVISLFAGMGQMYVADHPHALHTYFYPIVVTPTPSATPSATPTLTATPTATLTPSVYYRRVYVPKSTLTPTPSI